MFAEAKSRREYRDQLAPMGRKPILFVMMNNTAEADAIVGVLMLREGWDVKNVTVIVGLRPYSAKANILPEQTIGRGLRLMFRDTSTPYIERVDIIGNQGFIRFVEQLEREEDIRLDTWNVGVDRLVITVIEPVAEKAGYDITIPRLSPILARSTSLAEEIDSVDVMAIGGHLRRGGLDCSDLPHRDGAKDTPQHTCLTTAPPKTLARSYRAPEQQLLAPFQNRFRCQFGSGYPRTAARAPLPQPTA